MDLKSAKISNFCNFCVQNVRHFNLLKLQINLNVKIPCLRHGDVATCRRKLRLKKRLSAIFVPAIENAASHIASYFNNKQVEQVEEESPNAATTSYLKIIQNAFNKIMVCLTTVITLSLNDFEWGKFFIPFSFSNLNGSMKTEKQKAYLRKPKSTRLISNFATEVSKSATFLSSFLVGIFG